MSESTKPPADGPAAVPEDMADLFRRPVVGTLATLMPDGSPHLTAMWVDHDGRHVLVNTLGDRLKARNMRERPEVAVSVLDPDDPTNRWIAVRGVVEEMTEDGAAEHIDRLALRYLGLERFPAHDPERPRVLVKIRPVRVTAQRAITDFR